MKDIKEQCTTLEQSKKLVKMGFTKDSASLMWENFSRIGRDIDERLWAIGFAGGMHPVTTHLKLPCWTIADMMEIIDINRYIYYVIAARKVYIDYYYLNGDKENYGFTNSSNLRDSLFNCLVWLKENKYL